MCSRTLFGLTLLRYVRLIRRRKSVCRLQSVTSVLSRHFCLGGGRIPPPTSNPPQELEARSVTMWMQYLQAYWVLKTNKVTVIIYSLTCCEASGLAARAYRFNLKHTILYTHKFIPIAGVWLWHDVDFTYAFTSRLQSAKTKVRQDKVLPRLFNWHQFPISRNFCNTCRSL